MYNTLTVAELIEKLQAIEDKSTPVLFFCQKCKQHQEIQDMKDFGFVRKREYDA